MNKAKFKPFTAKYLDNLKPKAVPYRKLEGGTDKGFGVQVSPGGVVTFILQYNSPITGKRRIMSLGQYDGKNLSRARNQSRDARASVIKGEDPQILRDEEKERQLEVAKRSQLEAKLGTVQQLFDLYIEDLEIDGKRAVKQVRSIYDRDIRKRLGTKKAKEVSTDDVADIVAVIAGRGASTLANRTRSYIRAAFAFGRTCRNNPRWRTRAPDFGLLFNPAADVIKAKGEQVGQTNLKREDVRELWMRIGVEAMAENTALVLKLLLATGQRVEEVLHARWEEFDLDAKLWTIPGKRRKTRNKILEDHLVPLTAFHLELLEKVKAHSGDSEYLFPDRKGESPRKSDALSQAVRRFCIPEGKSIRPPFPVFQPRDIRRTWKTLAGSIGLSLDIRNRIQGHAFSDVGSRHYDRFDYLGEKRAAMDVWTQWLELLVNSDNGNVVKLGKSHAK